MKQKNIPLIGTTAAITMGLALFVNAPAAEAFNPQPEPPARELSKMSHKVQNKAFNPQLEPSRAKRNMRAKAAMRSVLRRNRSSELRRNRIRMWTR
ncbi:MAG: hypothetical protein ABFS30_14215 [Pseudomonadota bacterium]